MRNLREWLHGRKCERMRKLPTPPMPALPAVRRPLTASCKPATTENSPFFKRLPFEIRRLILIEAFGDRTVHFDLRLLPPLKSRFVGQSSASESAEVHHASLRPMTDHDFSKPWQWQWRGSECHALHHKLPFIATHKSDCCWKGKADLCDAFPGEAPTKCIIGVMSWLLTCRQAYVEGVEVLYQTNWVSIEGSHLVPQLPKLLPPQRLLAIGSVALQCKVCLWRKEPLVNDHDNDYLPVANMQEFVSALNLLPTLLPNIRHLYVSLHEDTEGPGRLGFR